MYSLSDNSKTKYNILITLKLRETTKNKLLLSRDKFGIIFRYNILCDCVIYEIKYKAYSNEMNEPIMNKLLFSNFSLHHIKKSTFKTIQVWLE